MFLFTINRRHFINIIYLLIALLGLSACEKLSPFPVLGNDSVTPLIVEDHSQALAYWAEQGIHNAVLINYDAHDDIRRIPESKISSLKDIYWSRDWEGFKEADTVADSGLYNVGSWIYAGARLGVIREVFWVVPQKLFPLQNEEHTLQQFLKSIRFSADDIETFRMHNNQFRGSFRGTPFTICSPESLPTINGPLLLSIDTDFFPLYSDEYQMHYLEALHRIFTSLFSKKYSIQGAAVSYSVNGEYLQPHLRWVADTAAMIIEKPEIIEHKVPDILRLKLQLDNAYRVADASRMFRYAASYTSSYTDPSVLLYTSFAHMLKGDTDMAYEVAMASCKMDKRYCAGLPYIGNLYFLRGKTAKAVRFFKGGFSADPEMENGLFCLAHCLSDTGNLEEAIAYYKREVELNGSFPADFLIFETFLLSGDRSKAMDVLKNAVSGLVNNSYAEVLDGREAKAIYSAIDYSEKEGLTDLLKTLQNNPAVKNMFINYPRN